MITVWLLADDRAGNVNQMLGIVEAMNVDYQRKDIRYNTWVRLPNALRGKTLLGITADSKKRLRAPWPDVVLSAGRRTFPVARYIRKMSGNRTKIVQLMNPGAAGFQEADLVVLPAHDMYRGEEKNVMTVIGTPHRIFPDRLNRERHKWDPKFAQYLHPRVAVIVGGATKDKPFTIKMAYDLVQEVKKFHAQSLLITTSRRTPSEIVSFLHHEMPTPHFFYRYGDQRENPYFGLLACADKIVVSGDSMSMCSECCGTGLPVYIFAPNDMMSKKHKRFHQMLYRAGYAAPLGSAEVQPKEKLNPAIDIANRILEMVKDE